MTPAGQALKPETGRGRRTAGAMMMVVVAVAAFAGGWWAASREQRAPARSVEPTAPEGMVRVPGGITQIGAEDGMPAEQPVFLVDVAPFYMDIHPVTVAQFRVFVAATGHVTEAEKLGDAAVYDPATGGWRLVRGADWRQPMGPGTRAAPDDHPVTQVSWNDAVAYAKWAGKRLPTEVEWEHAARNARDSRSRYPWGDSLVEGGRHRANIWQGSFPAGNTGEDGYLLTSPVGAFGKTELGLTDMGGNVWEWTADWFRSYAERGTPYTADATSEKVQRGGSFLCHESYCHGYRVSARSHSTPDSAMYHVGFRLVKDGAGYPAALRPRVGETWISSRN